ncbi:hypothetical protein VP217E381_P0092 [Vibrio phage 217E38-1]|nr:hypothetical protein VP217E381_P0092 [Vibrio phage 217E38-1]
MGKSKKQVKKDNLRYLKEKVSKCGSCRFFHKSICDKDGDVRYRNQQSCYQFKLSE